MKTATKTYRMFEMTRNGKTTVVNNEGDAKALGTNVREVFLSEEEIASYGKVPQSRNEMTRQTLNALCAAEISRAIEGGLYVSTTDRRVLIATRLTLRQAELCGAQELTFDGKNWWVRTFIPGSSHADICNDPMAAIDKMVVCND